MTTTDKSPAEPLRGTPLCRYFLDKKGVETQRMANAPGKGHFDIAQEITGSEQGDMYARMAALGFARVLETDEEIHVECKRLTSRQRDRLNSRSKEVGRPIRLNTRSFVESKDPRASQGEPICSAPIASNKISRPKHHREGVPRP